MPDPTSNPKIPARRPLSDADYAERGRRLTAQRAQEHQRARERLKAAGAVRFRTYVPAVHEQLIRKLVAEFCALLNEGASPRQILLWQETATAWIARARAFEGHGALPARDKPEHDGPTHQDEATVDSTMGQELGLVARRRRQWQRRTARRKAAGWKRIALVAPEALKPAIGVFLARIRTGSSEALLPATGVAVSVCPVPMESRHGERGLDAPEKREVTVPAKRGGQDPASRVPSPGSVTELAPQPDAVGPRAGRRWREADPSPDPAGDRSPLFDDVKALDRFARPGAADSPAAAD